MSVDEVDGTTTRRTAEGAKDTDRLPVLLQRVFGRDLPPEQVQKWRQMLDEGLPAKTMVRRMTEAKAFAEHEVVPSRFPPGHFFSPVVNPPLVRDYLAEEPRDMAGIDLDLARMEAFWAANREAIAGVPFTEAPDPAHRYCYGGGAYNHGDGITLWTMMHHFRPRRVVEIGSGYSTACMLDAAGHAGLDGLRMDCIEPYPARLLGLLRPGDMERVTIHPRGVQLMPLGMFESLEPNDILFIDSTHVLKTGSDVHYELFHILPVLKPGVIVHFHDCRFPFEYSEKQIFTKNLSWNEAYAVRALLMFSKRFRVFFWGSFFAEHRAETIRATNPTYLRNPGSALWVEVTG